jgi:hypothetical protein
MKTILNSIGLSLNILGVILISLHSLYDYGLSVLLKLWEEEEFLKNRNIFKNIDEKIKAKNNLTPLEKEQFIQLLKNAFSFHIVGFVVSIWLWVNKYFFFFHPWDEDKPRAVNRFLWNFAGLFLILVGFIFQLISSLSK